MKIHLHLGVHKTATTFIQERLKESLTELNAAGIGYMPLWRFRSSIGADFMSARRDTFRINQYLDHFFPICVPDEIKCLIISDENLLGHCGTFITTGQCFPRASHRLRHFKSLLNEHEIHVFCGIRSYETFIPSAYCEGLRTTKRFLSFDKFMEKFDLSSLNWVDILCDFERALQPSTFTVWQFERFKQDQEQILEALTLGARLRPFNELALSKSYSSYSQTAIEAMEGVASRIGPELAGQAIRFIGEAYPKANGHPAFQPFDALQRRRLQERYYEDCLRIPKDRWCSSVQAPPSCGLRELENVA